MPASRALKLASNLCQSSIPLHPSKVEQESRSAREIHRFGGSLASAQGAVEAYDIGE